MKSKVIVGLLFVLLCFEFALATYSILAHQWIGLAVVTLLIFAVMYLLDREVRKMKGDIPGSDPKSSNKNLPK